MKKSDYLSVVTDSSFVEADKRVRGAYQSAGDMLEGKAPGLKGDYPHFLKQAKTIGGVQGFHLYTNLKFGTEIREEREKIGTTDYILYSVGDFIFASRSRAGRRKTLRGGLALVSQTPWQLLRRETGDSAGDKARAEKQEERYNKFADRIGGEGLDGSDITSFGDVVGRLDHLGRSLPLDYLDAARAVEIYSRGKGMDSGAIGSKDLDVLDVWIGDGGFPVSSSVVREIANKNPGYRPFLAFSFQRADANSADAKSSRILIPVKGGADTLNAQRNTELIREIASTMYEKEEVEARVAEVLAMAATDREGKLRGAKFITSSQFSPATKAIMKRMNEILQHTTKNLMQAADNLATAGNKKRAKNVFGEWEQILQQDYDKLTAKKKEPGEWTRETFDGKKGALMGTGMSAMAQFLHTYRGEEGAFSIHGEMPAKDFLTRFKEKVKGFDLKIISMQKGTKRGAETKYVISLGEWVAETKNLYKQQGWVVEDKVNDFHESFLEQDMAGLAGLVGDDPVTSLSFQVIDPERVNRIAELPPGALRKFAGVSNTGAVENFLGAKVDKDGIQNFHRFLLNSVKGLPSHERTEKRVELQRQLENLMFGFEKTQTISDIEYGKAGLEGQLERKIAHGEQRDVEMTKLYSKAADNLINAFSTFKHVPADHAKFLQNLTTGRGMRILNGGNAYMTVKFDDQGLMYQEAAGGEKEYIAPRIFDLNSPYMIALAGLQAVCSGGVVGLRGIVNAPDYPFEFSFPDYEKIDPNKIGGAAFTEWSKDLRAKVDSALISTRAEDNSLAESLESLAIIPKFMALQRGKQDKDFNGLFSKIVVANLDDNVLMRLPDGERRLLSIARQSVHGFDKIQKYLQLRGANLERFDATSIGELRDSLVDISKSIRESEANLLVILKENNADRVAITKKIDQARQDYGDDWLSDSTSWVWDKLISPIVSTFNGYIDYFLTAGWRVADIAADFPNFLRKKVVPAMWESAAPAFMLFLRSFIDRMTREVFYDDGDHNLAAVRRGVNNVLDKTYGIKAMSSHERTHFEKMAYASVDTHLKASAYGNYIRAKYEKPSYTFEGDRNSLVKTETAQYEAVLTHRKKLPSTNYFSVIAELKPSAEVLSIEAEVEEAGVSGVTVIGELAGSAKTSSTNLYEFYRKNARRLTPRKFETVTGEAGFRDSKNFHEPLKDPKAVNFFSYGGRTYIRTTYGYEDAFGTDEVGKKINQAMTRKYERERRREEIEESDRRLPAVRKLFQMLAV